MVEHQLSGTEPATLLKQLCHCSVFPSSCNKSSSLVLDNLERTQEVVFSTTPQADLEDQFTAKYAIGDHEPDLEAGNTTDQFQGTKSGGKLLYGTFFMRMYSDHLRSSWMNLMGLLSSVGVLIWMLK